MRKLLKKNLLAIAIGGSMLPTAAHAQNLDSISSQINFDIPDRPAKDEAPSVDENNIVLTSYTGQPTDSDAVAFLLSFRPSFDFDTNPSRLSEGSSNSVRFRNDLMAITTVDISRINYTAVKIIRIDNFSNDTANDLSAVIFSNRISYKGKKIQPFVSVTPILVYGDFISNHLVSLGEVGVGFSHKFKVGSIPASIEAAYVFRFATIKAAEEHRPEIKLTLDRKVAGSTALQATGIVRPRFFVSGQNENRRDWNFDVSVALKHALSGNLNAELKFQLEHNSSNFRASDFTAWDIGPRLGLSAVF